MHILYLYSAKTSGTDYIQIRSSDTGRFKWTLEKASKDGYFGRGR